MSATISPAAGVGSAFPGVSSGNLLNAPPSVANARSRNSAWACADSGDPGHTNLLLPWISALARTTTVRHKPRTISKATIRGISTTGTLSMSGGSTPESTSTCSHDLEVFRTNVRAHGVLMCQSLLEVPTENAPETSNYEGSPHGLTARWGYVCLHGLQTSCSSEYRSWFLGVRWLWR